jgi:hypothetical protein
MPLVIVPPPYRGPTGGVEEVRVRADSVRGCIEAVDARFPGFQTQVLDAEGRVHRFVSLFVNGDEIPRERVDAPLGEGDRLEILAAIAGG